MQEKTSNDGMRNQSIRRVRTRSEFGSSESMAFTILSEMFSTLYIIGLIFNNISAAPISYFFVEDLHSYPICLCVDSKALKRETENTWHTQSSYTMLG